MTPKLMRWVAVVAVIVSLGGNLAATASPVHAAPSLSATFSASWANQPGPAHPDDTITYTATITNTGSSDATGMQLADTSDGNTTLVPNSVHSSPIARPDSYNAIGNVPITVPAPGLLANDSDPDGDAVSLAGASSTSANGGTVTAGSDGAFTYDPPVGFNGTDSFTYNIADADGSTDTATVTITVSGHIWFIDNSQGTNGNGTLDHPFNSIAAFNSVNDGAASHPATGDAIFVYRQNTNSYSGPLTLLAGQQLIGQGAKQSITALTALTPPSGSATLPSTGGNNPVIASSSTNLTVSTNNLVDGVTLSNSGGTSFVGNGFGTLTVADTVVSNSAGQAIDLNNGQLSAAFTSVSAAGASDGIVVANTTGSFTVTGDGSTAGSGGTIQNISEDGAKFSSATNVSLSYMNFNSANSTDGAVCTDDPAINANTNLGCNGAVYLSNVSGVTLDHDAINTTQQNGVNGNNVTGFTLSNSTIQNAGTTSLVTTADLIEGGLVFDGLFGNSLVKNSTIKNNGSNNLEVRNGSGTLTLLDIEGNTFGATGNGGQANDAGSGSVKLLAYQQAGMNVKLLDNTLGGSDGDALIAHAENTAQLGLVVGTQGHGNTVSTATGIGAGLNVTAQDAAQVTYSIAGNSIAHTAVTNIVVNLLMTSASQTASMSGTISGNTLGVQGVANSATTSGGNGISLRANSGGTFTAAVTNNQIYGVSGEAIDILDGNGGPSANVTVSSNTIDIDNRANSAIFGENSISPTDTSSICLDLGGQGANTITNTAGYGTGRFAINYRYRFGRPFVIPGLTPSSGATTAQVTSFLGSENNGASPIRVTTDGTSPGYAGGSGCTQPTPPSLRFRADDLARHTAAQQNGHISGGSPVHAGTQQFPHTSGSAPIKVSPHRKHLIAADAQFASGNTFSIGTLPAGHSVTVTFQATVNSHINNPSGATSVTNQVTITDTNGDSLSKSAATPIAGYDTQTSIGASPSPSVFGQSVTLTAAVTTAATGTPSGTVQFMDGSTALGSPVPLSNSGSATLTTSALSVGSRTLKAVYSGDDRFAGSTGTAADTVNKADTSTTVASSTNPATYGQPVTFVATVSITAPGTDAVADPTGTVTFFDNNAQLGTGTLSTANGVTTASFTIQSLGVGAHSITATYGGDGNFNGSTATGAQGVSQAVQKADTTTTLASSASTAKFGQTVTFTATVNPATSGSPTGTVTFLDGTSPIGTGTLSTSGGVTTATLTASALSVGTHTITASYGGDTNYNGSTSSAVTETIQKADTTTSLTSSVNPSTFGQSTTLSARISINGPGSNAGGDPTGTVTFYDGSSPLGTVNVTTSGGVTSATLSTNALSVGSHTLSATYNGDGNFNGSSGSTNQTVNPASTTTSLSSSTNPSAFGQSVTFTATVAVNAPGTTAVASPAGSVTFSDGSSSIGTVTVSTNNGVTTATLTTNALAVGSHAISAAYSGDGSFSGSSGSTNQAVNKAATSTTVGSSVNPSAYGQSVTFTATVSVNAPGTTAVAAPSGTVTFSDGSNSLGSVAVTTTNGVTTATLTTAALGVGSHTIAAAYSGDGSFNGSSGSANQAVNKAATTTTLTSSVNPSLPGQSVTFTATVKVAAPGTTANGAPSGTVTFADNGTTIGTGTLSTSNGVTSATFSTSSLAVGSHPITATYAGDGNFTGSSDALTQSVDKIPVNVAVASSVNPSIIGQAVTFTATVSPAASSNATPSGTVTFFDGTANLGTATLSGGHASITTSSLAIGSHTITAQYSGDNTFKSGSGQLTQAVSYSINLQYDSSQAKESGSTIPIKVDLYDAQGNLLNSSSVTLTLASPAVVPDPGAPQPTGTFSLVGNHYQFNLQTTGYAPGTYNLKFTAGNDPTVHSAPFTIK
jgi:hypothetical protein